MYLENELRSLDQFRITKDGIHFDALEGQRWIDGLEIKFFDTGVHNIQSKDWT